MTDQYMPPSQYETYSQKPSEAGTVFGMVVVGILFWPAALIWSIVLSSNGSWRRTTKITGYVISGVVIALYAVAIAALVAVGSSANHATSVVQQPAQQASVGGSTDGQYVSPPNELATNGYTTTACTFDMAEGPYANVEKTTSLDTASAFLVLQDLEGARLYGIKNGFADCLYEVEDAQFVQSDESLGPNSSASLDVTSVDSVTQNANGSYTLEFTFGNSSGVGQHSSLNIDHSSGRWLLVP